MKKIFIIAFAALFTLASCSILDTKPQAQISPDDYFKTGNDLLLFTNPLYDLFETAPYSKTDDHIVQKSLSTEMRGGILPSTVTGWSWGTLRRINALLANADKCEDEEDRAYYVGLDRFFRAYFYFEKVKRFGDVPWIDHELTSDSGELYAPRDSRDLVMGHMIEDVDAAIAVLTPSVSTYRVNKWAALALKAQFCLFEGTWRQYHGEIEGAERTAADYLSLAAAAAKEIMDSGIYTLAPDYQTLFAESDADAGEYILAIKRDVSLGLVTNTTAYATMSTQGMPGFTKKFIDSFLMKDGTRFTDRAGWETMEFQEEMADRDPRLSASVVCPGYKRIGGTKVLAPDYTSSITGYQLAKWVMDETLPGVGRVSMSYNDIPVYRLGEIYLIYAEAVAELGTITQNDLDISVNLLRDRVGMPHLNLEEANANPDPYLLSEEYGYRNVKAGANQGVILEIRRERGVELCAEGKRYDDIKRWKEGQCITQALYGPYFPGEGKYDLSGNNIIDLILYSGDKPKNTGTADVRKLGTLDGGLVLSGETSGYVDMITDQHPFNEERDYLMPIPTDDRNLNNNLTQNPGWDDGLKF